MNKVYTYRQLRQLQNLSTSVQGLTEAECIDRVGFGVSAILQRLPQVDPKFVYVFAGAEDNGAYALATARHLKERGIDVCVYLFFRMGRIASSVQQELERCQSADVSIHIVQRDFDGINELEEGACIVDGLFGRELRDPLQSPYSELVAYLNELGLPIVSIDLPSGLREGMKREGQSESIIRAYYTVALGAFSPAHLLYENVQYVGGMECLSLGIDPELYEQVPSSMQLISDSLLMEVFGQDKHIRKSADMARLLMLGGRPGGYGHLLLATRAAYALGIGQVVLHTLAEACIPLQMTEPDLICTVAGTDGFHKYPNLEGVSAMALGVTSDDSTLTSAYILELLKQKSIPMVCTGCVATTLMQMPYKVQELHSESVLILTQEDQKRLYGSAISESECIQRTLQHASQCQRPILLLGYYSRLCCPSGKMFLSAQGYSELLRPALEQAQIASVAALLACGYDGILSAVLSCYLYAESANLCSASFEQHGYSSAEILSKLPSVLNALYSIK